LRPRLIISSYNIMGEEKYNNLRAKVDAFVRSLHQFESNGTTDQCTRQLCIALSGELESLLSEIKAIDSFKIEQLKLSHYNNSTDDSNQDRDSSANRKQQLEDDIKRYETMTLENENTVRMYHDSYCERFKCNCGIDFPIFYFFRLQISMKKIES